MIIGIVLLIVAIGAVLFYHPKRPQSGTDASDGSYVLGVADCPASGDGHHHHPGYGHDGGGHDAGGDSGSGGDGGGSSGD